MKWPVRENNKTIHESALNDSNLRHFFVPLRVISWIVHGFFSSLPSDTHSSTSLECGVSMFSTNSLRYKEFRGLTVSANQQFALRFFWK